jgi:hypothetical protein
VSKLPCSRVPALLHPQPFLVAVGTRGSGQIHFAGRPFNAGVEALAESWVRALMVGRDFAGGCGGCLLALPWRTGKNRAGRGELYLRTATRHGLWRCIDHLQLSALVACAQSSGKPIRLSSSDFFVVQHCAYAGQAQPRAGRATSAAKAMGELKGGRAVGVTEKRYETKWCTSSRLASRLAFDVSHDEG